MSGLSVESAEASAANPRAPTVSPSASAQRDRPRLDDAARVLRAASPFERFARVPRPPLAKKRDAEVDEQRRLALAAVVPEEIDVAQDVEVAIEKRFLGAEAHESIGAQQVEREFVEVVGHFVPPPRHDVATLEVRDAEDVAELVEKRAAEVVHHAIAGDESVRAVRRDDQDLPAEIRVAHRDEVARLSRARSGEDRHQFVAIAERRATLLENPVERGGVVRAVPHDLLAHGEPDAGQGKISREARSTVARTSGVPVAHRPERRVHHDGDRESCAPARCRRARARPRRARARAGVRPRPRGRRPVTRDLPGDLSIRGWYGYTGVLTALV